jgi:hypothetical protein
MSNESSPPSAKPLLVSALIKILLGVHEGAGVSQSEEQRQELKAQCEANLAQRVKEDFLRSKETAGLLESVTVEMNMKLADKDNGNSPLGSYIAVYLYTQKHM